MYVKNVLSPGQYVEVIPEGIPIVLQYGPSGNLELGYFGFSGKIKIPRDVFYEIKANTTVPNTVPIKHGTTWVKGVMYTGRALSRDITFDENCYKSIVDDYVCNPGSYNFFAVTVESTSLTLSNATAIRQWMSVSKFHSVPGFLVNSKMTKELYYNILKSIWAFKYPMVMAYAIFDGSDKPVIMYTGLSQKVIHDIQYDVDDNGFISVLASTSLGDLHLPVSSCLEFKLAKNDIVCLDNVGDILHVSRGENRGCALPSLYSCPVCGKKTQFTVKSSIFRCSNSTCPTTLYNKVYHLLYSLHVPMMTRDEFDKCINDGSLSILGDVFSSTMYQDVQFDITLYQLLDGLIPLDTVRNRHVIEQFVNHCSNNIMTLRHYVKNPSDISSDFDISDKVGLEQLKSCFTAEFFNDLNAALDAENVHVVLTDRKYEGDPIFRGKTLYITGEFNHGSIDDVKTILSSYACNVIASPDTFDESLIDGVLVGDVKEGVNGIALRKAKKHHIPVMEESWFFAHYEIDNDLKSKL